MTLDLDTLRKKAENAPTEHYEWAAVVLALIERVRTAEAMQKSCNLANANLEERVQELEAAVPRCGCGATSSVRGDPECDGCGKDCYYCTCSATKDANA